MRIVQDLIPRSNRNRPGTRNPGTYITIHTTRNLARGANASMHARYVKNPSTGVSWHYTVDDGNTIYQHLPTSEVGWHAGNRTGNNTSIGIEICENSDGNFDRAVRNAQALVKKLMKEHNVPLSRVVPHKHWSGKSCPHVILPRWSSFKSGISSASGTGNVVASGTSNSNSTNPWWNRKGKEVKELQEKLIKAGYSLPKFGADSHFGTETLQAVQKLQRDHSISHPGGNFYGTPGNKTMEKLNELVKSNTKPPVIKEVASEGNVTTVSTSDEGKLVVITHDSLNYRNRASWDDSAIAGKVSKGEKFTIARKVKISGNDTELYELISGTYITAHPAYSKLEGESNSSPKPASKSKLTVPSPTIRRGSRGHNVKNLQVALNALNFRVGSEDGISGNMTIDGLRRFQSVYTPREVDGVYGPNSRNAIRNELNKRSL